MRCVCGVCEVCVKCVCSVCAVCVKCVCSVREVCVEWCEVVCCRTRMHCLNFVSIIKWFCFKNVKGAKTHHKWFISEFLLENFSAAFNTSFIKNIHVCLFILLVLKHNQLSSSKHRNPRVPSFLFNPDKTRPLSWSSGHISNSLVESKKKFIFCRGPIHNFFCELFLFHMTDNCEFCSWKHWKIIMVIGPQIPNRG